jgi:hypothetical protein
MQTMASPPPPHQRDDARRARRLVFVVAAALLAAGCGGHHSARSGVDVTLRHSGTARYVEGSWWRVAIDSDAGGRKRLVYRAVTQGSGAGVDLDAGSYVVTAGVAPCSSAPCVPGRSEFTCTRTIHVPSDARVAVTVTDRAGRGCSVSAGT